MALQDLLSKIEKDAEKQSEQILEEAKAKAQERREVLQKEIDAQLEQLRLKGDRSAQSETDRILSIASLEKRKKVLSARQKVIGEVIDEALKTLQALPAEDYFGNLEKKLTGLATIGEAELILNSRDRERIPEGFLEKMNDALGEKGNLTLSEETRDITGGFILRTGRTEENHSFAAILQQVRNELEVEIAAMLFERNKA